MSLWARPRNEDAVVRVATSIISETQKGTAGPQQRQGQPFSLLAWWGTSQGQTITKEYYLRRLRDAVRLKQTALRAAKTWKLHHYNASAHSAHLIQTFIAKHNILLVRQAPYLPDMDKRDPIWVKRRHHAECDCTVAHHSTNCVPEVFATTAGTLRDVCTLPRGVLRRNTRKVF